MGHRCRIGGGGYPGGQPGVRGLVAGYPFGHCRLLFLAAGHAGGAAHHRWPRPPARPYSCRAVDRLRDCQQMAVCPALAWRRGRAGVRSPPPRPAAATSAWPGGRLQRTDGHFPGRYFALPAARFFNRHAKCNGRSPNAPPGYRGRIAVAECAVVPDGPVAARIWRDRRRAGRTWYRPAGQTPGRAGDHRSPACRLFDPVAVAARGVGTLGAAADPAAELAGRRGNGLDAAMAAPAHAGSGRRAVRRVGGHAAGAADL